jgi:thiopeptide-type bacteriocin biosynthesis protein
MLESNARTIPADDAQGWIYLKLYVGEAAAKLEPLIVDLAAALADYGRFERWFFLRYFDENGLHVRLRVKARPGEYDETARAVHELCSRCALRLPSYPMREHRPMVIHHAAPVDGGPAGGRTVRIEAARYEPELDKFAGQDGMPIAEAVFDASSRIAWQVLAAEADGKASRKTLAPCFLSEAAAAFPPADGLVTFWRTVSFRWLGGDSPAAREWRQQFFDKGRRLREDGIPVVASDDALSPVEAELLAAWRAALRTAAEGYAALPAETVASDVLPFHFGHLMSNRLGLSPFEEAYLAGLLEQQAETA